MVTGPVCPPPPPKEIRVEFISVIDRTPERRSSPATVAAKNERALANDGYVEIGTIRASQRGSTHDSEITEQLRAAALEEASKAGGDVVFFSQEGKIGTVSEERTARVPNAETIIWGILTLGIVSISSRFHYRKPSSIDQSEEDKPKIDLGTSTIDFGTRRYKALTSEGTVWRHDPELAREVAKMPERLQFFELIRGSNRATIDSALHNDPSLALTRDKNGDTPLHYAAARGDRAIVELLLSNHAEVNALNDNRWTPLDKAAFAGASEVAELLLEHGAQPGSVQPQIENKVEFTSIIDQAPEPRSPPATVAVKNEGDLASDGYMEIGTIRASQRGSTVDPLVTEQLRAAILEVASKAGGDIVLFSKEGEIGSISQESPEQATRISEGTVWRHDPKLAVEVAKTPERLHFLELVRASNLATIDSALHNDPSLALTRDKNGDTPLHYAAARGDRAIVELLLSNHAEVNAMDSNGWTPLREAFMIGAGDVQTLLLENGGHP